MIEDPKQFDLVIIGAGLCGLLLARDLQKSCVRSLILEKSRGLGGRLATRRLEHSRFDHGAQFYTHQPPLEACHRVWSSASLVRSWFKKDSKVHFSALNGMTSLAKELAKGLEIRLEMKVSSLSQDDQQRWFIKTETGETFSAKTVVSTAPLPQALELLEKNKIGFDPSLSEIRYAKALVGLLELKSDVAIGDHGYLAFAPASAHGLATIADQHAKGVSSVPAVTVTLNPEMSENLYESSDEEVITAIRNALTANGLNLEPETIEVKRWRYAQPITTAASLFHEVQSGLVLAGDGFGGPSLNGAARSANALAERLRG